jgi:hypothetical protein
VIDFLPLHSQCRASKREARELQRALLVESMQFPHVLSFDPEVVFAGARTSGYWGRARCTFQNFFTKAAGPKSEK